MGWPGEAPGREGDHGLQDPGLVAGRQALVVADRALVLADQARIRFTTHRNLQGLRPFLARGHDTPPGPAPTSPSATRRRICFHTVLSGWMGQLLLA